MVKRIALFVAVAGALMLLSASWRSVPSAPFGDEVGRVEHGVRLFGYEVTVGAKLGRTAQGAAAQSHGRGAVDRVCSVPDTVFVVIVRPPGRQQ
jgi:hypothetical protein